MLVLGIVARGLFLFPFHELRNSIECSIRSTVLGFDLVLVITTLPRYIPISTLDHVSTYSQISEIELVSPRIP